MKIKNQNGFTFIEVMLVLIFVAVISFAGYYVYSQNSDKGEDAARTAGKKAAPNEDPKLPSGWRWSDTEEYGFKFAYPQSFGDAEITSGFGMDDNEDNFISKSEKVYGVSFSGYENKDSYTSVSFATEGYYRSGLGSPCNIGLSIAPGKFAPVEPIRESWAASRQIIDQSDISGVETVSFTEDNVEACPDFEITIDKKLTKNGTFGVLHVYHTGKSKQYSKLTTQAQYSAAYQKDPDSVIDASLRDTLLDIAKSVVEL